MTLTYLLKRLNPITRIRKKKETNGIYSEEEFKRFIEKERARSDRNNHILSLLIFEMCDRDSNGFETKQLIEKIKNRIRSVDTIGWYDDKRIGLVLPYSSGEGASKLAEDICESLNSSSPKHVCEIYTYPLENLESKKD